MTSNFVVKQGYKKYPKEFLLATMESWPAGTNLVLRSNDNNGDLITVGYKQQKGYLFVLLDLWNVSNNKRWIIQVKIYFWKK